MNKMYLTIGGKNYVKVQSRVHSSVYHLKKNILFCSEAMPTEKELDMNGKKFEEMEKTRNDKTEKRQSRYQVEKKLEKKKNA